MSWRTTAVLFVILLALGGFVYYQSQQEQTEENAAEAPIGTLPPPTPEPISLVRTTIDNVRGVSVTRLEDETQRQFLRDEDGIWTQTVPTSTLAISQTMETLTTGLINSFTMNTLAPDQNPLSAYGLDSPSHNITLASVQDEVSTIRITLLIGNNTPTGNAYYLQLDGDPRVHIMSTFAIDNLINLIENPPLQLEPTGQT